MTRDKKLTKSRLEEKLIDLENRWKRAAADYRNLEKRIERGKADLVKFANASLIDKLLAVLDDLERAEEHLKDKGLTMAVNQFRQVLKTEEVEEIKALNEQFNPETMDCVEICQGPENVVVEVCQKGYKLTDKVLRPAKVRVGKGGKKDE
jgi:molecular chaperone GrpE